MKKAQVSCKIFPIHNEITCIGLIIHIISFYEDCQKLWGHMILRCGGQSWCELLLEHSFTQVYLPQEAGPVNLTVNGWRNLISISELPCHELEWLRSLWWIHSCKYFPTDDRHYIIHCLPVTKFMLEIFTNFMQSNEALKQLLHVRNIKITVNNFYKPVSMATLIPCLVSRKKNPSTAI